MACAQAGRDLRRALHECQTSLPRKVGACKILNETQPVYLLDYVQMRKGAT